MLTPAAALIFWESPMVSLHHRYSGDVKIILYTSPGEESDENLYGCIIVSYHPGLDLISNDHSSH